MNVRVVCAAALVWSVAAPASAQRADGPFSGLFGGKMNRGDQVLDSLDLRGFLFGAYDDNFIPSSADVDPATQLDPRFQLSGGSAGATASLDYAHNGDKTHFLANGGGSFRLYANGADLSAAAYSAGTHVDTYLSPRVIVNASGNFQYSPFYQFAPFMAPGGLPGGVPVTPGAGYGYGYGYGLASEAARNETLNGSAGLVFNYSKRSSFSFDASASDWRFLDNSANDLTSWSAHGHFTHRFTRTLGMHLGYGQENVQFGPGHTASVPVVPPPPVDAQTPVAGETPPAVQTPVAAQTSAVNQAIDAGIDYGDTLAFSRRTALSFSTSSTAIRFGGETHFRVNGSVMLTRGWSRSWSSWVGYLRNTGFIAGFQAPVNSDSITTGIAGMLASRVQWSVIGGYSRGDIGFSAGNSYDTFSAATRVDVGLTRLLGLYGEYIYYRYSMPPGASTVTSVPEFSRQSVLTGLSAWFPLVTRMKETRDTR